MKLTSNFLILPNDQVSVQDLLLNSGRNNDECIQTISTTGIVKLRVSNNTSLSEFVLGGLETANDKFEGVFSEIDGIIVVSQSYDARIPSLSTRIQRKFDLPSDTFCIDIMDGCSGYIKALKLASLLSETGLRKIMIVAGDINSMMTQAAEVGTKILFGDGISVSILEESDQKLEVILRNNGDESGTIHCEIENSTMHMNGFEVFRFTRNEVPKLVHSFLEDKKISIDSFELLALHQASELVVKTIFSKLKTTNKIACDFSCGEIGNLGAGSIGAWLSQVRNLQDRGDMKMLAVGFGSGLSWGLASVHLNMKYNEVIYV